VKRLLLTLALVLAASHAQGAAGALLDSIRCYEVQVKVKLDIDSTNTTYVSTGALDRLIREAIIEVMPLIKGNKSVWTTVTTLKQNTYSLDSTTVGVAAVEWSKNDSVKTLIFVPRDQWHQREHKSTLGQPGWDARPSYYDNSDDQLFIHPPPWIVGDTLKVTGWQKVTGIDAGVDFTSIKSAFRVAVVNCAAWKVAESKQDPRAGRYEVIYEKSLAKLNAALNSREQSETIKPTD
jgi:hypothetical protein